MTRRWHNLHATSWLVLLAAIAVATITILPADRVSVMQGARAYWHAHHGWPFTWLVRSYDYDEHSCSSIWSITVWITEFNLFYLICDIVVAAGWVTPLVGGYEIWRRRRARIQFRIKHMFLLVIAVAVCCSYFATAGWRRQKELEAIRELGDDALITMRWEGPNWLWKFGGERWCPSFWRVVSVSPENLESADINRLATFQNLLELRLPAKTKDEDLQGLADLRSLTYLGLDGSDVTDKGLLHLRKFSGLRWLSLRNTSVSDEAVEELRQWLPRCAIAGESGFVSPINARPESPSRFNGYQEWPGRFRAIREGHDGSVP